MKLNEPSVFIAELPVVRPLGKTSIITASTAKFTECHHYADDYIEAFPPNERRRALLSLLDCEAKDIVRDTKILDEEITAATFVRLRLTEQPDILKVRLQFQSRVQLPGERFSEFVPQLRNLARDALPDLDLAAQEDKVWEQITVGVCHQTLVKKFRKRPQITAQEAFEVAREVEQLEGLFHHQQIGLPQSISTVQPHPQRRPDWSRPPPRVWVQLYCSNPDFRPPPRTTSHGDCVYCRSFGTKAQACVHNRVGESHGFLSVVLLCPFSHNCPNSRVILIRVTIGGRGVQALVDIGAMCSLIRGNIVPLRMAIDPTANISLVAANGEPIQTTGSVTVTINLGSQRVTQQVTVARHLSWDVILGVDCLSSHGAVIDLPQACTSIDGNHTPIFFHVLTKPELLSMAPMDIYIYVRTTTDSSRFGGNRSMTKAEVNACGFYGYLCLGRERGQSNRGGATLYRHRR
ncbi:hypothetical protein FGIG_01040 [Fasciola gigantica]|uniref:Retropepsins domain-containing protein n=1 Tax=Fasciola gigantica TaxID=46835 RepID=A0A504Z750_FASGI|nr:hypothetical protein FGIG_01040 [Fasciola gigantica]